MNLDDIKQILDLVREHDLAEFELERDGLKVRVRKDAASPATQHVVMVPQSVPAPPSVKPYEVPGTPAPTEEQGPTEGMALAVIKSPIVGTLYLASEPGAPPFVDIGTVVKKGQVLCIIEAMKLMNEIDSEYDGEITSIYIENGQAVQYGERLFAIKPSN